MRTPVLFSWLPSSWAACFRKCSAEKPSRSNTLKELSGYVVIISLFVYLVNFYVKIKAVSFIMEIKILVIAVVKKDDRILLRKKPQGSLPYKETWYLFGGELIPGLSAEDVLKKTLKEQAGIDIEINKRLSWDIEIKQDHDGREKLFVYLDMLCEYKGGELLPGEGIERLEWAKLSELSGYDLVPPTRKLFFEIGYI